MASLTAGRFNLRHVVILGLFLLATVHCVRSIFLVNVSFIDLTKYAAGTERMPYQGRVAMVPVLRWSEHSSVMQRAAGFFDKSLRGVPHFSSPPEDVTPEKLACIAVGLLATLFAVGFILHYGWKRLGQAWWLPGALFLAMLYVTYAARYEAQYWYPYDLAHIAVFGIAAVCILYGWYPVSFALFVLDTPLRETSIFLIPCLLAVGYVGRQRQVIAWATGMAAVWVPVRLLITHRFAANRSDVYIHWSNITHAIVNPLHWPQLASAFGFMLIPLCFGLRHLARRERFFLAGMIPGIVMTSVYGVWYESRIWDEWLLPLAVLLSLEIVRSGLTADSRELESSPELIEAA